MILVIAALVGIAAFGLLVVFERRDRPGIAVAILLALTFADMLLYPDQNDAISGVLRVTLAGESFRVHELFIAAALAARLVVKGLPRRYSVEGAAWCVFLTWYTFAFVIGLLHDNGVDLALFHLKAAVYLGGGFILASGVPADRYVRRSTVAALAALLAIIAALSVAPTLASQDKSGPSDGEGGISLGILGSDTPTAMVAIAVVVLLVEGARAQQRRAYVFVCALGLLLVPFLSGQRAAIIGMGVSALLLCAMTGSRTWRQQIRVTPVEAGLLIAALAVPVVVTLMAQSINASADPDSSAVTVPLVDRVNDTFFDASKIGSAETRKNLWSDGLERIRDNPLSGTGLGTEYRVERAVVDDDLVGGGFHNILFDIAVRSGVSGLLLFTVACSVTLAAAVRTWRGHPDARIAALAIGATVALAGILAKGMFESVFEKYRLAVLIGLLLGVIGSASRSERGLRTLASDEPAVTITSRRDRAASRQGAPV